MRAEQILLIDAPLPQISVQIQKSCARFAQIAGHRRQQRARAHDVAAGRLALQALAEPQQRRAPRIQMRDLFDLRNRHAGRRTQSPQIARGHGGLEFVPTEHVRRDESLVDQAIAVHHVQQCERERGIAAGKGLQMNVGLRRRRRSNRIDDDHFSGRLRQPVLVGMRRRGVRIRSPHDDAGGLLCRARIEAIERGAVHVAQRDVSRHVANRVGGHLGCPEPIEESQRRNAGQQRDGAGVVRVQYRAGAVIGEDPR